MEDQLMDLEHDCDLLLHTTKKIHMKKSIINLEGKTTNIKKRCAGL